MIRIRVLLAGVVGVTLCAASVCPTTLRAQGSPAPNPGPTAHVRFWKTELHDLPDMRVTLKPAGGKHPSVRELGGGKPGYVFNNYTDEPAGHGTLDVFAGAAARPLVSLPANLVPGAFVTVLLSEPEKAGGAPRLEIIDDSSTAADATHSQITVRNFVTDLKDVRLTVGDVLNAQFVSGDSFLQMRGLPSALYPLRTVGTGLDGKPFDWNFDADFRQSRHQTLLIYPDSYGRIRPRLIADGESQATTPPPASKDGQR